MAPRVSSQVKSRGERFALRTTTHIWQEIPQPGNPYAADTCLCHGYDLMELMAKRGFVDVLYLLFRGELPEPDQAKVLNALMVGFLNPGPRHPATRAAMTAAVSKADPAHLLPIALSILSGEHLGAGEVTASMHFLRRNLRQPPGEVADTLAKEAKRPARGDWRVAPGFGTRFGDPDPISAAIACHLSAMPGSGPAITWGEEFARAAAFHGAGWLAPAVVGAALLDLGFHPRQGGPFYQLMAAPGLLAHGLEMAGKPHTAMPFVDNDHYFVEGG